MSASESESVLRPRDSVRGREGVRVCESVCDVESERTCPLC